MVVKGNTQDPCGDGTVLHTDCVSVHMLVVVSHHSFARCYHLGKLCKGHKDFSVLFLAAAAAAAAKSLHSCPTLRPHRQQPTRLHRPWDSPGKNTGVGCHFFRQYMKVKSESEVVQSCPIFSDPVNCSLSGFSVHGIFEARVLERVAIAFSD